MSQGMSYIQAILSHEEMLKEKTFKYHFSDQIWVLRDRTIY